MNFMQRNVSKVSAKILLQSARCIALNKNCRSFSYTCQRGVCHTGNDVVHLHSEVHGGKGQNNSGLNRDPIVLIHGVFGNRRNFGAIAKKLAQICETEAHCVDMRNHGDSAHTDVHSNSLMSRDVIHYIETRMTCSKRCILLGHSMGGRVAFDVALRRPDLISAVVIEDSSPWSSPEAASQLNSPIAAAEILQGVDLSQFTGMPLSQVRTSLANLLKDRVPDAGTQSFLLTNLMKESNSYRWRCNMKVIWEYMERGYKNKDGYLDDYQTLHQVDVPALCIRGSLSKYVQEKDIERMTHFFPRMEVVTLNASHWVHSQQPQQFVDVLSQFIKKLGK